MCDISSPSPPGSPAACAQRRAAVPWPLRGRPVRLSDFLAGTLFWTCAAAAVVAQGALLRSALGTAWSGAPRGAPAEPAVRVISGRAMELVWNVLPAVVLLGAFWWAWVSMHPSVFTIAAERAA